MSHYHELKDRNREGRANGAGRSSHRRITVLGGLIGYGTPSWLSDKNQNKIFRVIKKNLVEKCIDMVNDLAKNEDAYKKFYESFSKNKARYPRGFYQP